MKKRYKMTVQYKWNQSSNKSIKRTFAKFAIVEIFVLADIRDDVEADGEQLGAGVTDHYLLCHRQKPLTHGLADWVPA